LKHATAVNDDSRGNLKPIREGHAAEMPPATACRTLSFDRTSTGASGAKRVGL
jgi:hypothetical protein